MLISHYRVLERIGRDNDTVIYRARDLTLDRDVAVKILSLSSASHPDARERFRREARIASLVSHPHICAVHDSGEEKGVAFLVCELLEGRALDDLLEGQPLPAERLLDVGVQLADALAAVHRRGIVHGGVKPSNVFITVEGHVKLLEVGLMSAWWETASKPGALDGSAPTMSVALRAPVDPSVAEFHPYQSPEQLAGEPLDHRSDLFSTGAVLYEMATGVRAFAGGTPTEIAGSIAAGRRKPVQERNPAVPDTIAAIIERALEPDPAMRYPAAAELLADLRKARRRLESSPATVVERGWPPRRWSAAAAAAVLVLALAGVARWWWPGANTPPTRHTLLVGSIANGTNDPDFDGTLRQALTVHLSQSPFLDIVSDERLRQTLQMMGRQPDAALPYEVAREACQRLGLGAMLDGSVSAVGRVTIVALVATDCATGGPIMREQVEVERKEDVLRAVGRIASAMRRSLGESVASLETHNVPIEEATTPSLEALKAYTAGVTRRAAGEELESIPFFERAFALDPKFALAYTTLSSVYGNLGETGRSEYYAERAFEHRENVSERERLFITYQYHDRATGDQLKAREALEFWKRAYPHDYRPANALAVLLNRLGEYEQAIAEAEEAIRRNPAHSFPYSNLAYAYRGAGRYADARAAGERAVALGIETLPTRRLLYQLAELENDSAAAQAHLDWAETRGRGFDLTGAQAQVAAYRGRMREARVLFHQTVAKAERNGFPQVATGYIAQMALTDALYGNRRAAVEQARRIPSDATYAPILRAATALALAGGVTEAETIAQAMRGLRPDDTLLHGAYRPVTEAAVLLARGRPDAAVDALRRGAPYERGSVAALLPIYLRGQALVQAGRDDDALREFRAVLDTRGADPFSPVVPLSHLAISRALARKGDSAGSRLAYEAVLEIWRAADDELLRTVRDGG